MNKTKKQTREFVEELMSRMTLNEKIGQLYETIYDGSAITGPEFDNSRVNKLLSKGQVGSILGLYDNQMIYNLQKNAVEKTRLGIPLFFANDIIHGCRTLFPINLAMSCSWNPELIKESMRVAAVESSHSGVQVVFSPMVDLVRDPRWGRVMESNGEDPYLSSLITKAYVEGYQGKDLTSENSVAACVKHYAGYGAALAGRDYNSVEMSLDTFYQYYLPPFKQAVESNVQMVMTSFNTFNGVPSTCNKFLLKDVLKKQLKFNGVVVSDYTASQELLKHKVCKDEKDVALKSIKAGLDHEMVSTTFIDYLVELSNEDEEVLKSINEACYRVLAMKYRIGLFDNPYKNIRIDFENYWLKDEYKETALKMANESICLLENRCLPLKKEEKVLFVGPFVDEKKVVGAWGGKVNFNDTITLLDELKNLSYNYKYVKGCNVFDSLDIDELKNNLDGIDKIVLTIGEEQWMSGENKSRVSLSIPSVQDELLEEVMKLGIPVVLVVHAGRPLIMTKYKKYFDEGKLDAIVYSWFLGTMSGKALADTLYGINNPSGKLTMSFPYAEGQIPIFYNALPTGRPQEPPKKADYLTRYLDCPNEPLYPFGYGKSYSNFIYSDINLENNILDDENQLTFSLEVLNDSDLAGLETIQVYIECLYDDVSRPLKELKNFKKLWFNPHETKVVNFNLTKHELNYYLNGKNHIACGKYALHVGQNSKETKVTYFIVK